MRCPACQAELPENTAQCPACSTVLGPPSGVRKARRRGEAGLDAEAQRSAAYDAQVKRIVLVSLASFLPGVGLLLGPVVAVLVGVVLLRAGKDPAFTAKKGAYVTLFVALAVTVCNWVGLWLVLRGWYAGG